MENRERLSSRLGFILLSAGCAIGCGNVWKFPWMAGQYGGGSFVLIYVLCLILLGLPVMIMEFSLGRASQASPVKMYQKLEKPGQKWHIHGYFALFGNICLMSFYTVVAGWLLYYFVQFITGSIADLGFVPMITNPGVNMTYMLITVAIGFLCLCFKLQGGLERVTKYMMVVLLLLMVILAINSATLPGAKEGLAFYLKPDFKKIDANVVVGAMNQAFFSLSLGIGSMAIFGSYIDKKRSLMGESINVICLDTFVAIMAGLIIFPACFTYGVEVNAGPSLLFDTMATVFKNMAGGRWWGSLFFLFMVFAAFSTVLAVFENILACVRELTGWSRKKGCLICGIGLAITSTTTALGFSVLSGFVPFAEGSSFLDMWDFLVSTNLLPLGSLLFVLFCCNKRYGWGWDKMLAEANAGKGLKVKNWMKPLFMYVVPVAIIIIYVMGLINFSWN
ncbi:MAG: sodium-dependent transporter [Clostridia bacterium]|nr:sodium-dependent transporter [Clostridia bacterium]MBQ6803845.1 sodium-dependent transporter [Clostridia bacterium]